MSLQHIVLFKFPPRADRGGGRADARDGRVLAREDRMATKVRLGKDITQGRNPRLIHLLYTEFPDFDTLTAYRAHPVHLEFLKFRR